MKKTPKKFTGSLKIWVEVTVEASSKKKAEEILEQITLDLSVNSDSKLIDQRSSLDYEDLDWEVTENHD